MPLFRRWEVQAAALLVICALSFFLNLGTPRLWDRDEPRNAGAALEMLERRDWVVPTFNDELRGQKPVLTYWLILSAYNGFGVHEFSARFWSAVLATGTVFWTWAIARRLVGPAAALWSGIALAAFPMFSVAAHAATPDASLVFCVTQAIGLWVLGTFQAAAAPNSFGTPQLKTPGSWFPASYLWSIPFYATLGLGVLAKGPVGCLLPAAIVGMLALLGRREAWSAPPNRELGAIERTLRIALHPWSPRHFLATAWSMKPLTGALVVLLVAAPWYIWVGLRTEGDFLAAFFVREHLGRATTAMENHSGGPWYYPLALLAGTFPWSVFALPVLAAVDRALFRGRDQRPIVVTLSVVWIALFVLAFSLARTKLPSYVTPCHPGIALTLGWFAARIASPEHRLSLRWSSAIATVLCLVGIGIAVAVPLAANRFEPQLAILGAIGAIPLLAGIAVAIAAYRTRTQHVPAIVAASGTLACIAIFGFATVIVDSQQQADDLLVHLQNRNAARVAAFGKLESSWVFYARHPIYELDLSEAGSSTLDRPRPWSPKPRPQLEAFLAAAEEPYVITTADRVDQLTQAAQGRLVEIARVDAFLDDQPLVLFGPPTADRTAWSERLLR